MKKEIFRGAVIGIIRDKEGRVLYQKRQNTGYNDGCYQLPGGHIEGPFESPENALIREMKEELGLELKNHNMILRAIARTTRPKEGNTYISYYFEVVNFDGIPENVESEKCECIVYLDHKVDSDYRYSKLGPCILDKIEAGIFYSDFDISEVEY